MKCESCHSDLPEGASFCPTCGVQLAYPADPGEFEYAAFISYRHLPRDQAVAKSVQDALESFRMPRGIPARGTSDGRLGKCFRDEDELAATHSLPNEILAALKSSSALIVICSPATRESIWVQREIEAFIKMHGRERIFAVLADGSSADSIPDQLRMKGDGVGAESGVDGISGDVGISGSGGSNNGSGGIGDDIGYSSPLAVDLRPEASKKSRTEMLRLIAAVAGCGYDDLRQRDRSRRRKRIAIGVVIAIAILATLAGTLAFASNAHRNEQIAESKRLASESAQLLYQGDRYGAIEKALEALPESESSGDRPIVPEARNALENALEINPISGTPWLASYEIRTGAPLGVVGSSFSRNADAELEHYSVIAVNDEGGYFAISDGAGNVSTYDIVTGKKLADCVMPEDAAPLDGGLYARSMGATKNYVIVANGAPASVMAVFDAKTGELVSSARDAGCPSFNTSYGDDLVSMSFPLEDGGYSVFITDIGSGTSNSVDITDVGMVSADIGTFFNTPGKRFGDNYSVFGNRLFFVQVDNGAAKSVDLAYPEATSLEYVDGLVLVASAEPMPSNKVERRFAIEAFDQNLERKWKHEGTFSSEMIINNDVSSLLSGVPEVHEPIEDGSKIVVSVGRKVIMLDSATGELTDTMSFDQTIAAVDFTWYSGDEPGLIATACGNGTINSKDLAGGSSDPEGDGRRLNLPYPIRWAHFAECDGYFVLLAVPADSDNRIVSYRTDWTQAEQPSEAYSLDDLIELAHTVRA